MARWKRDMMAAESLRWYAKILVAVVGLLTVTVESQKSSEETPLSSFRAKGELLSAEVTTCGDTDNFSVKSTIFFEEIHFNDGPGGKINKSLLRIPGNHSYTASEYELISDFMRNKFFIYGSSECNEMTSENFSLFNPASFGSKVLTAPVYTILSEFSYRIVHNSEVTTHERGLLAKRYELDLNDNVTNGTIVEYATVTFRQQVESDTDLINKVPLTVDVCTVNPSDSSKRLLNRFSIMHFSWDSTDEAQASPPPGVFCPGYGSEELPDLFSNAKAMILRTELTSRDGTVVPSDVTIDFDRNLLRFDGLKNEYFYSHSQGLIYRVTNEDVEAGTCQIIDAADVYRFDWTFVDFEARNVTDFFGVTNGFTVKTKRQSRGIECQVVQGMRMNYPPNSAGSLWEWCVASLNKSGEEVVNYVVHLDIYHVHQNEMNHIESYSLYHVELSDPRDVYHDKFTGLEPCFPSQSVDLQVYIDVQDDVDKSDAEAAMESIEFRARFLDRILTASEVSPDTYRFGTPHVIVSKTGKFAVFQFLLFGGAKESQPSHTEVRKRLEAVINTNPKVIEEEVNGITFRIRSKSLDDAHPIIEPTPQTTTTSEPDEVTTNTEPTQSPTEPPTTDKPDPPPETGHSLAALALAAIGLFVVGGGVGVVIAIKFPLFLSRLIVLSPRN